MEDSNFRPRNYQFRALTTELIARRTAMCRVPEGTRGLRPALRNISFKFPDISFKFPDISFKLNSPRPAAAGPLI